MHFLIRALSADDVHQNPEMLIILDLSVQYHFSDYKLHPVWLSQIIREFPAMLYDWNHYGFTAAV